MEAIRSETSTVFTVTCRCNCTNSNCPLSTIMWNTTRLRSLFTVLRYPLCSICGEPRSRICKIYDLARYRQGGNGRQWV